MASTIGEAWASARAAWPGIEVGEAEFAVWVEERRAGAELAQLNTRDLYLACACSRGDAAALQAFDAQFAPSIATALASMKMRDDHGDEIRQRLRTKLFVGERPRIASYSGRGELGGWVRASAVREAIDLQRGHRREVPMADPLPALDSVPLADPALAALKEQYKIPMKAAFAAALGALAAADRALLRYKYIDGASLDEIATIIGAHRATVARKLKAIRDELAAGTRERLIAALGLAPADAESIIRLVHSQVDASLSGLD